MTFKYIDTHTHLNLSVFNDDLAEVLVRTKDAEVAHINIGTTPKDSKKAVEIAEVNDGSWAIVGLHPVQVAVSDGLAEGVMGEMKVEPKRFDADFYRTLAKSQKVVGIGECGYDYFHTSMEDFAEQEEAFIAQIALANELNLPLMIHTRNPNPKENGVSPTGRSVYEDAFLTLKQYAKVPGNIHFYAGTYEEAKKFFDIGFTVSFTGVITFAPVYEEVVKAVPLDLMHAETDSPFVAPVPHRGKRNEPSFVIEVVKKIAAIKGLKEEEVREQLLANAEQLYGIEV